MLKVAVERIVIITVVGLALLTIFQAVGPLLAPSPDAVAVFAGEQADRVNSQLANTLAAVDQCVAMLFAATVGMFLAVGFILKETVSKSGWAWNLLPSLAVFVIASAISFYLGFVARLKALHSVDYAISPMTGVSDIIGWQGVAVAFAFIALVVMFFDGTAFWKGSKGA